jgi:hypothetical protein
MNMPRRSLTALLILSPLLLAMGIMGEAPRRDVPETGKPFGAVLVDVEGVSTEVSHFSYDGEAYLPAYRGRALVVIPFERIAAVEFGQTQNHRRQARVLFQDQQEELFWVDEKLLFLGKVTYGTFQIQAKDLQRIRLQPEASR